MGVASTAIFQRDLAATGTDQEQVSNLSNFLNKYLDARVILVLHEAEDGRVKGSFRTAGEDDVSAVAKALGGGGHRKAAGFTIPGRLVETPTGWQVERRS